MQCHCHSLFDMGMGHVVLGRAAGVCVCVGEREQEGGRKKKALVAVNTFA